jgi:hypothetical protein
MGEGAFLERHRSDQAAGGGVHLPIDLFGVEPQEDQEAVQRVVA